MKRLGFKAVEFQAKLILSLVYIVVVPVFAFVQKFHKLDQSSTWSKWNIKSDSIEDLKKQF